MDIFRPAFIQLLDEDRSELPKGLVKKSRFLRFAHRFNLDVVVGDAAPNLDTSALGKMWPDAVKSASNEYVFEFAAELPFFLPSLMDERDYSISYEEHEYVVSTRMCRVFCGEGFPKKRGTEYYLVHRHGIESLIESGNLTNCHIIPIRTFITVQFSGNGGDAEEVISLNFNRWRLTFVEGLSKVLDALRMTAEPCEGQLPPLGLANTFPTFWVISDSGTGAYKLIWNFAQAVLRPLQNVPKHKENDLNAALRNGDYPTPETHALALARSLCHGGYLEFSILQVCVACECALSRRFKESLLARGVSNTKLNEAEKDITLSQLLNLHLFIMCDMKSLPKYSELVGTLNWARSQRNSVAHTGKNKERVTVAQVEKAIAAAEELISHLYKPVSQIESRLENSQQVATD